MTAPKEQTVTVKLAGRAVAVRRPNDGALMVLARVSRGIPGSGADPGSFTDEQRARLIRNLGTLGKVVEGMIVSEADRDWLDDAMVSGEVSAEEVLGMISEAGRQFNSGPEPASKAVRRVRR